MGTPRTGIPLQPSTIPGFVTANAIARSVEGIALGRAEVVLDLDGTTVVSATTAQGNRLLNLGSGQTLTADETVELPAGSTSTGINAQRIYWVRDATTTSAYHISVKVTGGSTTAVLPRREWVPLWTTGTEVEVARTAHPFRWFVGGAIGTTATLCEIPLDRDVVFPAGLADSAGYAGTAPSGGAVAFDLKKNGAAAFGTMNFADGVQTATFSAASDTSFAAGDRLAVVSPGSVFSISDVGFTLRGLALGF
jgi:hypothetical protein